MTRRMARVRALGRLALWLSLFAALAHAGGLYVLNRNAYYTCDALPRPAGSLPYEAGYAGHGTTSFPLSGVECLWNATNGTTFTTLQPDYALTALLWIAMVLAAVGIGLLAMRWRLSTPR